MFFSFLSFWATFRVICAYQFSNLIIFLFNGVVSGSSVELKKIFSMSVLIISRISICYFLQLICVFYFVPSFISLTNKPVCLDVSLECSVCVASGVWRFLPGLSSLCMRAHALAGAVCRWGLRSAEGGAIHRPLLTCLCRGSMHRTIFRLIFMLISPFRVLSPWG